MRKLLTLIAFCIATTLALAQNTMNIYQSNGSVLQIPLNSIDSITYTLGNPGQLATLTTLSIGNIAGTSATSGGNITSDGGTPVTQRGVVWNTNPNPTTANSATNNGSGTGSYTSNLIGLTVNTTYYVRAFATNSAGTTYGNEISFTTTGGGGSGIVTNPGAGVTFNGYTYSSIVLGNGQEWMAENLRTTTYANGDPIPNVTDDAQWQSLTEAWAHYNNDSQYENPYGKLYNYYAVADPRNICPTSWHVPSDAEWTVLSDYLGGASVSGGKMKSTGTQYWQSPNTAATNESGFSGLPGSGRGSSGSFSLIIGYIGYWWSSTESDSISAWNRYLNQNDGTLARTYPNKRNGISVRCLRD